MSERSSSAGRPSSQPSALLMPTADFGASDGPKGPSLLVPAMSSSAAATFRTEGASPQQQLFTPDDDAEADRFIGQAPSPELQRPSSFSMFQHNLGHDPFSDVRQPKVVDFSLVRPVVPSVAPASGVQPPVGIRTAMSGPVPLPNISAVPLQNIPPHAQNVPPFSSAVAPSATTVPSNLYRMSGKPHYAAPPTDTKLFPQQDQSKPSYLPGQQMAGVPLAPSFVPGPPPQQQPSQHQASGFLPAPFEPGGFSSFGASAVPSAGVYPHSSEPDAGMRSYQIRPPVSLPASGQTYQPAQPHWYHRVRIEGKDIWKPFSNLDSRQLEETANRGASVSHMVSVAGGRYEVNIRQRLQTAIYWHEEASPVRRCLWFYRPDGENQFVPYEEDFSAELEESYRRTVLTSDFHKRLVFPSGETIVIHNPQVIVQFPASAQPDAYGNTSAELRPRVVKRGVVDLEELPADEHPTIDHLVLVVQGIRSTCDLSFRSTVDCVDNLRDVASDMMMSHFKQAVDERRVSRVEFLPVRWHEAMRGHIAGLDRKLKSITLGSVGKLRQFSNDHLMDNLLYGSPAYVQDIVTTVGNELNRLVKLFRSRNPSFTGGISVVGHGLGSQILFDILVNQSFDDDDTVEDSGTVAAEGTLVEAVGVQSIQNEHSNGEIACFDQTETESKTLESVLEHLGLSMYLENFKKEQIDLKSLSLCEDADVKELGIPLGPRKKLQGFLKEYQQEELQKQREAEQKAQQMALIKAQEEAKKLQQAALPNTKGQSQLLPSASSSSVTYSLGAVGIGAPLVRHPQLCFEPENFFALGSSVAMLLALKGNELLGEEFVFPTCPGFFNIFHPFDPLAYRMEPLIVTAFPPKPVQIPHHKGRKRLHLELKESLTRIGYDLKQRIIDSVKNTWRSLNNFALSHKTATPPQDEVEREVDTVLSEMTKDVADSGSVVASSVADEDDVPMGSLNQGRRIDFVLQEKPIEIFNDYMFALGSYSCYWESEDTALMMLKEIYLLMGIVSKKFGPDINPSMHVPLNATPPPQPRGFVPPPATSYGTSNPLLQAGSGTPNRSLPQMGPSFRQFGPLPGAVGPMQPMAAATPPRPAASLSSAATVGPPPLTGFVKK